MKNFLSVFDLDGTLCFSSALHGVKLISNIGQHVSVVRQEDREEEVKAFQFLNQDGSCAYLACSTQQLCWRLSELSHLVIATGARPSTFQNRFFAFPFGEHIILESGGVIYDKNFVRDRQWERYLQSERDELVEMSIKLRAEGWILDDEGRTSALRIRAQDNPGKTSEDFARLAREIELPPELKKTSNSGHFDVILAKAGKEKALAYLADILGHNIKNNGIGFGDDINDLEMLSMVKLPMLVRSRFEEAMEMARKNLWMISREKYFAGINELLGHAIGLIEE